MTADTTHTQRRQKKSFGLFCVSKKSYRRARPGYGNAIHFMTMGILSTLWLWECYPLYANCPGVFIRFTLRTCLFKWQNFIYFLFIWIVLLYCLDENFFSRVKGWRVGFQLSCRKRENVFFWTFFSWTFFIFLFQPFTPFTPSPCCTISTFLYLYTFF